MLDVAQEISPIKLLDMVQLKSVDGFDKQEK